MIGTWPRAAVVALSLVVVHGLGLVFLGGATRSLLSELVQLASVVLTAVVCLRSGRRLPGRPGRFWLLLGMGFTCWALGQILILRYVNVLHISVPAIASSDVPFLAFYLPVFAALFPEMGDEPGVDWARTLDLAQVGIVLGSVYLHFFLALNLGVETRVITLHFGFLDSYSLLNALLVGSYVYTWWCSAGEARALYGRLAAIFALYSVGDTLNTYQVIQGTAYSGDWLDLSYTLPFALITVTAARWPSRWGPEGSAAAALPQWRLFPLLPPVLVLLVAGSVARVNLTLATILIGSSFVCFAARLAVTQHRQLQTVERLRRSEAEYRSLVENAPYGICRYAAEEDRFLSVNQALLEMLGYPDRDALLATRPSRDVFCAPGEHERLLVAASTASTADPGAREVEWKRADGTPLTVRLRTQPTRGAEAAAAICDLSAEDITQTRKLEDQLRQALKMEAIGRLAGGVAHDFNNLLMVVTGSAELLRRRLAEGSPELGHVSMIRKAAQDAADLTRQLLAFSRRQNLEPKVLDLNQVLAEMSEMLPRLLEASIEQRIRPDSALGRVRADLGQMRQVVLNLAVNARDAMTRGGVLTLETSNVVVDSAFAHLHPGLGPGSYVSLTVSDTGRGMDPETRARVFEPFFTTKEKGKGTGLGLATVYGIVKQSGGHVRVESAPGQGTTFTVLLPRFEGPLEVTPRVAAPRPRVATETILLVEDSTDLRGTIREFLTAEGYLLREAVSAEEALELLRRRETAVDLVITDVVLPGRSGLHLSDELAALRPGTPVVLMSGYADHAVVDAPLGRTVLQKPISLDRLAEVIREQLAGSPE